jgi:hypothetical protein
VSNRAIRWLVAIVAIAAISVAASAPLGFAQDPGYTPAPPSIAPPPAGSGPAQEGSAARKLQLKRCIAKAQTKFGDNRPRMKAAIKKCKKKYG